jgi:hypothetical protein
MHPRPLQPRARAARLALLTGMVVTAMAGRAHSYDVRPLPPPPSRGVLVASNNSSSYASVYAQPVPDLPPPPEAEEEKPNPYLMPQQQGFDLSPGSYVDPSEMPWFWQWFPSGLVYRSYMASPKEARLALVISNGSQFGPVWDATLGARIGLLRWGTPPNGMRPQGFEVQLEAAAMPRIQPILDSSPLVSCDYRIGIPVAYADGPWQFKTGYYHISSHLGDEFMKRHPTQPRINYVRDSIMFGVGYFWTEDTRLFAEFDYAPGVSGGAEPCEFQFGVDYSPAVPGGAPFAAVYGNMRQELDFGGFFVLQAGWQWRGGPALSTFRLGLEYFNGQSPQYEFFNQFEQHVGFGLWYDF